MGTSRKGQRARAETGPLGRGRGDGTHLRDLFAILQVPHRRGLGGDAGQPPPAWGECALSETHPPLTPLLPSGGRESGTQAPTGQGQAGLRDRGADQDPLLLAAARPGQGCPGHVRSRAPALRPPLPPPPPPPRSCRPCAAPSRAPTPALSPQRAALQHSQPPAGFCPHRRISRPASLKSRRLNLRTRPRTSLAGAAARRGAGAGRRARARRRAGSAGLEARTGTRGSPGAPRSQGVGRRRREAGSRAEVTGPGTLCEPAAQQWGARRLLGRRVSALRGVSRKKSRADPAAATSGGVRSVPLGRGQSGFWAGEDLAGAGSRAVSLAT